MHHLYCQIYAYHIIYFGPSLASHIFSLRVRSQRFTGSVRLFIVSVTGSRIFVGCRQTLQMVFTGGSLGGGLAGEGMCDECMCDAAFVFASPVAISFGGVCILLLSGSERASYLPPRCCCRRARRSRAAAASLLSGSFGSGGAGITTDIVSIAGGG